MSSLRVEEARRLLWDTLQKGPTRRLPLAECLGSVLAEDLTSDLDFPPFDRVTMDGYAVRAQDLRSATREHPVTLEVVGGTLAGKPFEGTLAAGQAVKAMTGAVLPDSADAVVPVEATMGFDDAHATIFQAPAPGANVARRGEDSHSGEVLLRAGVHLTSRHIQTLASAGHAMVPVVTPPLAAVASTGDELVAIDEKPGPGQIRESNNACVRASLAEWGIPCTELGSFADEKVSLEQALREALERYELLVLSGGVSKGEKDLVKPVLEELGVELRFTSLHLKPGHPAVFGTHGKGVVFALPGNPVAVFTGLRAVFSAGLRKRLGYRTPTPPRAWGRLGFDFVRKGNRPNYLPVVLEESSKEDLPRILSTAHHGSGDFRSLAEADALAWFNDDRAAFSTGEPVEILRLDPFHSV
jgi:molybdopterin molybdotransferase